MKPLMVHDESQSGFTLIEITLAIAISSLLLLIVFNGQRTVRETAQFSDAIERANASLISVKNEANTTVNLTGTGDQVGQEVIGKVAHLTQNSSVISVETLIASVDPGTDQYTSTTITTTDHYSITLPYKSIYTGPNRDVVFSRELIGGDLQVYIMKTNGELNTNNYVPANQVLTGLSFGDGGSRTAIITVDPQSHSITRAIFN